MDHTNGGFMAAVVANIRQSAKKKTKKGYCAESIFLFSKSIQKEEGEFSSSADEEITEIETETTIEIQKPVKETGCKRNFSASTSSSSTITPSTGNPTRPWFTFLERLPKDIGVWILLEVGVGANIEQRTSCAG